MVLIIAFSGVASTPFDVTPGTITLGTGTVTASGITTVTDKAAIIFLAEDGNATFSNWSGSTPTFSEIVDYNNGTNSVASAWGILGTAGPTGNKTVTASGNYYCGGMLLALRPATITIPSVNAPIDLIKCSGDQTTISFSGSATDYYWTNDNPNINLGASGVGAINFTPDATSQQKLL